MEEIFEGTGEFCFGALFEPLAGEDEGGDGGGGIEKMRIVGEGQEKGGEEAVEVGGENAATEEGEHVGVKMFQAKGEGFEDGKAEPEDDGTGYKQLKDRWIRNI